MQFQGNLVIAKANHGERHAPFLLRFFSALPDLPLAAFGMVTGLELHQVSEHVLQKLPMYAERINKLIKDARHLGGARGSAGCIIGEMEDRGQPEGARRATLPLIARRALLGTIEPRMKQVATPREMRREAQKG